MQPLLITGSMRSGTTLIANFLDAQSGMEVKRDFLHIHRIQQALGGVPINMELAASEREHVLQEYVRFNDKLNIHHEVGRDDFMSLRDFYVHVLDTAYDENTIIRGHKTTDAFPILRDLLTAVPALKVICIIRDPRDVVTSSLKRWPARSWALVARQWEQAHGTTRDLKSDPRLAARVAVVRYEDMLNDPHTFVERMSDFLDTAVVVPDALEDLGSGWAGNSSFDNDGSVLSKAPIGRWQQFNPILGRRVEAYCRSTLVEAGYSLSTQVTPTARIMAHARGAASELKARARSVAGQAVGRSARARLRNWLGSRP